MELLRYNEERLARDLERLPRQLRVAFAAACAERLLPSYFGFAGRTGRGNSNELASILQCIWDDLLGKTMTPEALQVKLDNCMRLVPEEDEGAFADGQPYAEDAAAALAYTLRCRVSGKSQDAAWAARRVYDALDHYVINREGIDPNEPGADERVLSDPIVQAELLRQRWDLDELLRAADQPDQGEAIKRLQQRARRDAAGLFRPNRPARET